MIRYNEIKHVRLEISTRCNAACPLCPRNLCGVDIIDDFPLRDMRLSEAQSIFPVPFIKQLTSLNIDGNLGDIVTARDGLEIVRYFRNANPSLNIIIGTNASAKTSDWWVELAKLRVRIIFCLDGLKGTHELYRRQTNWDTVIKNARAFIDAGGIATWKMILFDHNKHQVNECRELSKQLGFYFFDLQDHGRNQTPVFDQKQIYLYNIGSHPSSKDFNEILKIRKESEFDTQQQETTDKTISCETVTKKSIFVTATGEVYPCCYTAFYPRTMMHYANNEIRNLLPETNNALEIGIESSIEWFNKIEESWSSKPIHHCTRYCTN